MNIYTIRPLEWELCFGKWEAKSPFGTYGLLESESDDGTYWAVVIYYGCSHRSGVYGLTIDAAKAAAEADYQSRMSAGLVDVSAALRELAAEFRVNGDEFAAVRLETEIQGVKESK